MFDYLRASALSPRESTSWRAAIRGEAHEHRQPQAAKLRTELARIGTAERGPISELEQPGDPAYRARIRQRYAELYQDRTKAEAQLAALKTAAPQGTDPALLDELPYAAGLLADAPDHIKRAIYTAFASQALYNKDDHQVTIWATITDATSRPSKTCSPTPAPTTTPGHQNQRDEAPFPELAQAPM
jgi:hypothetical protein